MKYLKATLFGVITFLILSFTITPIEKQVVGSYGEKEMTYLTLKEDYTFQYSNLLNGKDLVVNGKWKLENGKVYLEELDSKKNIPTEWEVIENGACVKSKKGLNYLTLCGNCKN